MGNEKELAEFAAEVKRRRMKRGLSQVELGKIVGCSGKQMNHVEWARNWPSMGIYMALCRELGFPSPLPSQKKKRAVAA